jgi:3-hydroxymyristoyl/3-hydroxydecanoyl-(acyl carrier protein) dehydratase
MRVRDFVDPAHPALAGHFPGNPIVPGALLLVRVLRAAGTMPDGRVNAIQTARFHTVLRPGEAFDIELERGAGATVKFARRDPDRGGRPGPGRRCGELGTS